MPLLPVSEATQQWCRDRSHPFVTYNPWLDRSYCRCGNRQKSGDQSQDHDAKRAVFHNCEPGDPCRCYLPSSPAR
jgi:hypothetical protein